jgi:Hint domain
MTTYKGTITLTGSGRDSLGDTFDGTGSIAPYTISMTLGSGGAISLSGSGHLNFTLTAHYFDGSSYAYTYDYNVGALKNLTNLSDFNVPIGPLGKSFGISLYEAASFNADRTGISLAASVTFNVMDTVYPGGVPTLTNIYGSGTLSGSFTAITSVETIAATDASKQPNASGNTPFTFTVSRLGGISVAESTTWSVAGSGLHPATASDFAGNTLPSGTVSFAAGQTSQTITIDVVNDGAAGFDETFAVSLPPIAPGELIITTGTTTATGTILAADVCLCRGTLILTDKGEVAVEELAVGDRVKTLSGACKPIVWIGFGRDLVTRRNRLARPIIVRQSALADNVPRRDLYLTHGHALYLDGVLIPVENLVNHRSILWDDTARVVEYYHIELADHDVLFAEGAPAESYYDANNRALFQNTREGSEAGVEKPSFAAVLSSGETVETVWAELFERAGLHLEHNTTDDPDVHLLVDGKRLDPAITDDGVYSFALERPPAATLRLSSRSGVPSLLGLGRSDHRQLGVVIRRIILWHAGIPTCFEYDAPQLREGGCHPPEDGYCWTDGEFALPARFFTLLNGGFTLVVQTEATVALVVDTERRRMRYPVRAAAVEAARIPAAAA